MSKTSVTNSQSVNNCFFLTGEAVSVKRFDFSLNAEEFVRPRLISKVPSILPLLFHKGAHFRKHVGIGKAIVRGLFSALSSLSC